MSAGHREQLVIDFNDEIRALLVTLGHIFGPQCPGLVSMESDFQSGLMLMPDAALSIFHNDTVRLRRRIKQRDETILMNNEISILGKLPAKEALTQMKAAEDQSSYHYYSGVIWVALLKLSDLSLEYCDPAKYHNERKVHRIIQYLKSHGIENPSPKEISPYTVHPYFDKDPDMDGGGGGPVV